MASDAGYGIEHDRHNVTPTLKNQAVLSDVILWPEQRLDCGGLADRTQIGRTLRLQRGHCLSQGTKLSPIKKDMFIDRRHLSAPTRMGNVQAHQPGRAGHERGRTPLQAKRYRGTKRNSGVA